MCVSRRKPTGGPTTHPAEKIDRTAELNEVISLPVDSANSLT
jgi:hypothetical protein